ncbi:MAG: alcohol dehydrogenase family protein [Pseudomonadota bacterium]
MTDLPETMRAVVLTGHGGLDKLVYREDWPTPRPGPGEVVIKVGACGLNTTDINTRTAWYSDKVTGAMTDAGGAGGFAEAEAAKGTWGGQPLTFPRIQGADVAGRIAAVGAGVDPARIGERVIVDPWLLGLGDWNNPANTAYFGSECDGGFAEYTKVRSENALKIESALSDAELAALPCTLHTAETLVMRTEPVPGETAVIAGASGGVGTAAVQLAKLRGARVLGIAKAAKAQTLLDLGADAVVDREAPDLTAAIREAAGGPVDVAIDVVGGPMFMPLLEALRHGGRYAASGAIAGPMVEVNLRTFYYRDLQLRGATITPPGTMARLVKVVERGQIQPMLAATFPLKDLAKAQEAFLEKRHVGNMVLTVEGA